MQFSLNEFSQSHTKSKVFTLILRVLCGCLESVDWTTELEYWTGLLNWNTGLEYWTGILEYWNGLNCCKKTFL